MSNHDVVSSLQPAAVWTPFAELAAIPRPSAATRLGLSAKQDAAGNGIAVATNLAFLEAEDFAQSASA